jgi:hypothetical protein
MTTSTLLGTNNVTELEIINIPAVPFTRTHNPIHHRDVIAAIKDSVHAVGLDIIKSEYVVAAEGKKMFGVYDLSAGSSELCWSIGIRNSMDKSLALGITGGTRVFVCENLSFTGDFVAFRRHTSGLDADELAFLAFRAMRTVVTQLKHFQQWHEGLRDYTLTEADMKILLVEIMTNSVIPPSKFKRFNELYQDVYDRTLWGFHEAATDTLRGSNLLTLPKKNKLLNGVIDAYINSLDTAQPSTLGDFYHQRTLLQR